MSGEGMISAALDLGGPLSLRTPALAVAKPREGKIALFVAGPKGQPGCCEMTIAEADRLHETLGSALALMRRPGRLPAGRLTWRGFVNLLLGLVFGAIVGGVFIVSALASGGAG